MSEIEETEGYNIIDILFFLININSIRLSESEFDHFSLNLKS